MAAPTIRRSGHSKKAQLSTFAGYILAGFGVLLGGGLLAVSLWSPGALSWLRGEATDIVAPVGEASAAGRTGTHGFFATIAGYYQAGAKNARLEAEVKEAHVRLVEAEATKAENDRLKALLGLRNEETRPVAFARLIGSTGSSTRRIAYLSAGSAEGVQPGMPVRSPLGLIGRVLEVGDHSARVLLLTDGASMVPVRRTDGNVIAFAEGRADGTLRLRLINLGINPLKKGDVVVTSGAGGVYRPGIAVAVVHTVTRDGAVALPLSNPSATIHVAVEPVWVPQAQEMIAAADAQGASEAGQ